MAFAVIKTGGKQYKVREGQQIRVEKLPGSENMEKGAKVAFEEVLMLDDGSKSTIGTPTVAGAAVTAEFAGNDRAKKIIIGKFKSKTRYRRTAGHRQPYSTVKITSISTK